jgi:glyoxylase-like metal-dependent hydrolase (beta-lactamase superfamily II)
VNDPAGWSGGTFGERAVCVLAPNPSPMTLDGTNTWVLREPGARQSAVVDPGPLDEGHLARVLEVAGDVGVVLLTHGHVDHSESAGRFAELAGCDVRALDPRHRVGSQGLHDGDVVSVTGLEIAVVGTPGHTSDSLSFVLRGDRAVLTGDTVLGRGTTVVAHPDGRLGAYLGSLRRLRDLAYHAEVTRVLPGHGPVLDDAGLVIEHYLAHRRERLEQVSAAVDAGAVEPMDVVRVVYADVDESLWPAAELSVRAQLDYLAENSSSGRGGANIDGSAR